jgi:hypothetical protein
MEVCDSVRYVSKVLGRFPGELLVGVFPAFPINLVFESLPPAIVSRVHNAVGKVHVLLEVDWRRRSHFAFGDFGEALRFEKGNMEDRMDARELGRKLQAISDA